MKQTNKVIILMNSDDAIMIKRLSITVIDKTRFKEWFWLDNQYNVIMGIYVRVTFIILYSLRLNLHLMKLVILSIKNANLFDDIHVKSSRET